MIYIPCNICGADNWVVRFPSTLRAGTPLDAGAFRCTSTGYGEHAQIVACQECGHLYANPTWEPSELLSAYSDVEDTVYLAERSGRELTFQRHLQRLQRLTGPADGRSALDVGAYIGVFVEVAQAAGWRAVGLEPSRWAVQTARARGLTMIEGTLTAPELLGRQFDLITLWDVIEHVLDPRAELSRAHALLRPGGWLAVHTMDSASPTARLMGSRWPWLMEMHVHFFSRPLLADLLQQVGFDVVEMHTAGRTLRLGYLAGRLGGLHPFLGRTARRAVNRLRLAETAVPVNFGDLFTIYAVRRSP